MLSDNLALLAAGFAVALEPGHLLACFTGVFLGTLIGVLPGISAIAAVALLLPVSLHFEPTAALMLLAGIYYGTEYGGSITSILLNVPGTPSAAISCQDGHPMAKAGRAGPALVLSALASFGGGLLGIIAMLLLTPTLVDLAFYLGPVELFAAMLLTLVATAVLNRGTPTQGLLMVILGMALAMIGTDSQTGIPRFTAGLPELRDGIPLVVLALGLFGVSEVMLSMFGPVPRHLPSPRLRELFPNRQEWRQSRGPTLRGGLLGVLFGALPGTGPTIASIAAYTAERQLSPTPERFGTGMVAGLTGPEAANNGAAQTAFIPTLLLGIPGSATMALILGALILHGVPPGPLLPLERPELYWGLMASFVIGNLLLLILNIPLIGLWVRLLHIPAQWLYPSILLLIALALYGTLGTIFSVWLALAIGILGFLLRRAGLHLAPVLIGFVLAPMVEDNARRSLAISQGELAIFWQSPIAATLLGFTGVLLIARLWPRR